MSLTEIIELSSDTRCLLAISSDGIEMCENVQADLDEELETEQCKYGEVDIGAP